MEMLVASSNHYELYTGIEISHYTPYYMELLYAKFMEWTLPTSNICYSKFGAYGQAMLTNPK